MFALVSNLRNFALCCTKGGVLRYEPDDQDELYTPEEENVRASAIKERITLYKEAMAKSEESKRGSVPTPTNRSSSTSNVVSMYESLATKQNPPTSEPPKVSHDKVAAFTSKLTNSNLSTCTACQKSIYPTDPIIHSFDKKMHAACFICHLCGSKMTNHPMELHLSLPETDQPYFLCAKCQEASLNEHKPKTLSTNAGEKITVEGSELGDVDGVMEAIGDELEEILLDNVPKCETCGGDFLQYSGKVYMVGQCKYHESCWETGKPDMDAQVEKVLTPPQAARYLPERLIVRIWSVMPTLKVGNDKIGRVPLTTLYFTWESKVEDCKRLLREHPAGTQSSSMPSRVQVEYELDDQAVGNPNYKDPSRRRESVKLLSEDLTCDLIGDPFASEMNATNVLRESKASIAIHLSCRKFQVVHSIRLEIPRVNVDQLDLVRSQLSLQLSTRTN